MQRSIAAGAKNTPIAEFVAASNLKLQISSRWFISYSLLKSQLLDCSNKNERELNMKHSSKIITLALIIILHVVWK